MPYHDYDWLEEQFVDRDKSVAEIAEDCDVDPSTIWAPSKTGWV